VFRHPKYYKDLATNCRRDNKPQRKEEDEEATSDKQQAPSDKQQATEQQAE
jgi:hypothetical protein